MYTVKRAAELTGLPPDTLRAWERRYGIVTPDRSAGGYRLYDERAIRRLAAMRSLVDSGWSASQAARRILAEPAASEEAAAGSAPGPGDVDALARAGTELDGAALTRALDAGFAAGSYEQVVDDWLMPALVRLGTAWQRGRVGVAGEHFVSAGVQRRLASLFDAVGHHGGRPLVVVGLAGGCRHELGVLAFAVALRRTGTGVLYVGGDLPAEAWVETVRSQGAVAAVIGVPTADDVATARATVELLAREAPSVQLHVGGAHQELVKGAAPLGHRIAEAARLLASALDP